MWTGALPTGGGVPLGAPVMAGSSSSGSSIRALTPAVTATSTSSGGPNPAEDGTRLARPLKSVVTLLWLTLRITGIAGLASPTAEDDPSGRRTVVRNETGAAMTGFGGEEKSVTRTTTG